MEWRDKLGATVPEVNEEHIAEIVSAWTGVPMSRLVEEESTRLLRMQEDIHARLIGQDDAVEGQIKLTPIIKPREQSRKAGKARDAAQGTRRRQRQGES